MGETQESMSAQQAANFHREHMSGASQAQVHGSQFTAANFDAQQPPVAEQSWGAGACMSTPIRRHNCGLRLLCFTCVC